MRHVKFSPSAVRVLDRIPVKQRDRIIRRAEALATNPHPAGSKKLHGEDEPTFRIRSGDYRIIYIVSADEIAIARIGDRKEIYK